MKITSAAKKILPYPVKHPLIVGTNWYRKARSLPAQSVTDISILKEILSNLGNERLQVLEWGAGSSTFYYSDYLKSIGRDFRWQAIENSGAWAKICAGKLVNSTFKDLVQIDCFEFQPYWEVDGYYPDPSVLTEAYRCNPNVEKYVAYPKDLEQQFDLIFIDGRFRRRCLLTALEVLSSDGLVILHDAQRKHYHPTLSEFNHVEFFNTGSLPGSSINSNIAVCALNKTELFKSICQKHASNLTSIQHLFSQ